MNERRNNGSNGWALLLGLVAGGAAGYFLASESGRKVRQDASKKLNEVGNELTASLRDQIDKASTRIEDALAKAKNYAGEASSSFQEGMEKAKAKVNQKAEEIKDATQSNGTVKS